MDKEEIVKLRAHLRRSLGCDLIQVTPNSRNKEAADVFLGERRLGGLVADEEDGDRSFFFEMKVPVERPVLQEYLRKLFENEKLTIAARAASAASLWKAMTTSPPLPLWAYGSLMIMVGRSRSKPWPAPLWVITRTWRASSAGRDASNASPASGAS